MEKDAMSEEKKRNSNQSVSYVGNSWIVTQSKSHPGHVYYFNTVTGEAVWNLSDAEIKKSASIKQMHDCPPCSRPITCREPKGNPPPVKVLESLSKASRTHHQQHSSIKLFQQQKQHHSEEMFGQHSNVKILPSQQQSTSVYSDIPMGDLSSFDLNALSNQINAYNIISTPNVYPPDSWPIPRTQQIIITPTIPLLNQAQPNVAYDQLVSRDQMTGPRFGKFQNTPIRRQRLFQPRNQFGRGGQRVFKKSASSLNANDLRQQLYLKRRLRNISNSIPTFASEDVTNNGSENLSVVRRNETTADISSHIADIIEEEFGSYEKVEEMDCDNTDAKLEETPSMLGLNPSKLGLTPSKLDVTSLKSLAPPNADPETWHIVVDLQVLLEEFEFLNAMIDTDDSCRLTIPKHVMTELKDYIARSNNIPARRMFHSLSQLIENGCVLVAEECTQDYGATITNPTLKTCLQLFDDNFHVVLLAKDNDLLSCKKFIKINIFSVSEVKSLLGCKPLDYVTIIKTLSQSTNTPSIHKSLFKAIPPRSKTPGADASDENSVTARESHNKIGNEAGTADFLNNKVDAAIQTDKVTVIDPGDDEIDSQEGNLTESTENAEIAKESSITHPVVTTLLTKRREIKLKRSISHGQSTNTNDKRPFRWRRNRNTNLLTSSTSTNDKPTPITEDITDNVNNNTETQLVQNPNNNETDANLGEITQSRESSVGPRKENITTEETPTSGVISNTESNVDVDIDNTSHQNNQDEDSNVIKPNIVLYDIDSQSMEESLKIKCEEWVFGFMQIMEEALNVVLRKEPLFSKMEFPPPWTLHEAAICIGNYSNNFSVKYIADKLTCSLFELSDISGKVRANIEPRQFMKMYSYGVALLSEIKAITTCEDVETAEESLQKLLSDIKNPFHVCSDPIIDRHEESINIQETNNMDSDHPDFQSPISNTSNARSAAESEKVPDETNQSVQKSKTTYLPNLSRTIVTSPIMNTEAENETNKAQVNEDKSTFPSDENRDNIPSSDDIDESDNFVFNGNIVRNFGKCSKFEEVLKNKYGTLPCEVNHSSDHADNSKDKSAESKEYEWNMHDESGVLTDPNETQIENTPEVTGKILDNSKTLPLPSKVFANSVFKILMSRFLEEVRKALKEVKVLCDKCYLELKRPQLSHVERNDLKHRVEKAYMNIAGICLSLKRMQSRDPKAPTDNMRRALKKINVNITDVDRKLVLDYWVTTANCKKSADVFLKSIREIMAAFKS